MSYTFLNKPAYECLYDIKETSEYHGFLIKKCQSPTHENFRVACFPRQRFDAKLVRKVAQLKHLNTSPLHEFFDEQNFQDLVIVQKDFQITNFFSYLRSQQFSLDKQFFLVLCLTMAEFASREIAWNNLNFETINLVEGHVMIDKFEFDFHSQPDEQLSLKNFKKFMMQFPIYGTAIEYLESYDAIVTYALNLFPSNPRVDATPYFHILKKMLNIQTEKLISQHGSNSNVYKVQIPTIIENIFKKTLPDNSTHIVIKSTIIPQDMNELQKTLNNVIREIELNEYIARNQPFATSFSYIRFNKQVFLFMPYYPLTLQDLLNKLKDEKKYFTYVELHTLCKQFADGLYQMHELKIMHRDLKPGNIFLSSMQITKGKLYIGDFDRSKSQTIHQEKQFDETNNLLNTPQYDPPELFDKQQNQTLKVDIWQFGLIMVQLANLGQFYGNQYGSHFVDYEQVYGKEKINTLLAKYYYIDDFLNLINDCLKRIPYERPTAKEVMQRAISILNKQEYRLQVIGQMGEITQTFMKSNTINL